MRKLYKWMENSRDMPLKMFFSQDNAKIIHRLKNVDYKAPGDLPW